MYIYIYLYIYIYIYKEQESQARVISHPFRRRGAARRKKCLGSYWKVRKLD